MHGLKAARAQIAGACGESGRERRPQTLGELDLETLLWKIRYDTYAEKLKALAHLRDRETGAPLEIEDASQAEVLFAILRTRDRVEDEDTRRLRLAAAAAVGGLAKKKKYDVCEVFKTNKDFIGQAGLVGELVAMVRAGDAEQCEVALAALNEVISENPKNQELAGSSAFLKYVISLVGQHEWPVARSFALRTCAIVADNATLRPVIAAEGKPALLRISVKGKGITDKKGMFAEDGKNEGTERRKSDREVARKTLSLLSIADVDEGFVPSDDQNEELEDDEDHVLLPLPSFAYDFVHRQKIRGYWFVATMNFKITRCWVPKDCTAGETQSWQIMKFLDKPPAYPKKTAHYNTLKYDVHHVHEAPLPIQVEVKRGDIIGVLGAIGDRTQTSMISSATEQHTPIGTLRKLGVNDLHHLFSKGPTAMPAWTNDGEIARICLKYMEDEDCPAEEMDRATRRLSVMGVKTDRATQRLSMKSVKTSK